MSKEQTPINVKILSQNISNNGNDFTAEQIESYFKQYANEVKKQAVLEALEREFSKIKIKESLADSAGDYIGETSIVFNGKEYYETEVKPNYK